MPGVFCISLDFELLWGMKDHKTASDYGTHILSTRAAIPQILHCFEQHQLEATWATVGFLMCRDKEDLMAKKPHTLPEYPDPRLSSYHYLEDIGQNETDDPYHYAPSLVRMIAETPGQEIGSHSFSHFYCGEKNISLDAFEEDTLASKNAAEDLGLTLESFVFPRNQYSSAHVDILKKHGMRYVRGNEAHWAYQPGSSKQHTTPQRAFRLLDSYLNLSGHHTYPLTRSSNVPASRFLRPFSTKLKRFEPLKLRRIKKAMTHAAKHHELFHLWWHPHNFSANTEANMAMLNAIADHFHTLQDEYGMQSRSMNRVYLEAQ